ncbi:class I SAM-dependent methyltransferase [Octadecabacter ascidiaceicola]|nr:class I SAM-dependent methyltransferase [Octadecabacter ascidiaceicola]
MLTDLTLEGIEQTVPRFRDLAAVGSNRNANVQSVEDFAMDSATQARSDALGEILTDEGSDKARKHNYNLLLAHVFTQPEQVTAMLEIGMGTNKTDVVSNMGKRGIPGASLRAFRRFLPNAHIYGADFDERILFQEDRISTFFVDQNKPDTLEALERNLPDELDLIIDDGLHSAHANLATLAFAPPRLRVGGWYICEDIADEALPVWEAATHMMRDGYVGHIIQTRGGLVFAVNRVSDLKSS